MKLRTKFLISIVLLIISMNFIFTYYILSVKKGKEFSNLEKIITSKLNGLSESSSIPLWDLNYVIISEQVKTLLKNQDILQITLYSGDLKEEIMSFTDSAFDSFDRETLLLKKQSIKYSGKILGYYEVVYSDYLVLKSIEEQKNNMILLTLLLIIVISIAIHYLSTYLLEPIDKIVRGLKVIEDGNLDYKLQLKTRDEFNNIEVLFNSLREKLKQRQEERDDAEENLKILNNELENKVIDRTSELEESLKELKLAQNQLIQSEKMSMLGRMVAGVTHEINSPLGICVTLSSNLSSHSKVLRKKVNTKVKKKELDNFFSILDESSNLILSNINRATDLIKSFKTIAVDQTSEFKRTFDLTEYLKDIKLILNSKFKNRKVELVIDSEDNISIYNNPGIFYQIFTNLINNSLKHAFDLNDYGEIKIKSYLTEEFLFLDYLDNGKGISESIKDRVFDKFFTTKRDSGGTGLGLHIIKNLIDQNLDGTIELLDNPESISGVLFRIKIKTKSLEQ